MSKLLRSIKDCMSDLSCAEDKSLSANFIFPRDFLGFKGHFPGKPILPGVCKIQAALLMLEEYRKKPLFLKEIVLAKFFSPVSCDEAITFCFKEEADTSTESIVRVVVTGSNKKIAQLHLKVDTAGR